MMEMQNNDAYTTGYEFTRGAMRGIVSAIGWYMLAVIVVIMLFYATGAKMDDSDYSRWNRSGMAVHIDAKTGLEYLSTGTGGTLIPRLDRNGKQLLTQKNFE